MVAATPEQYDPRRDPNYSRETSDRTPLNWQAVWALVREFEERAYPSIERPQMTAPYAQPQPWHYVQEIPSPVATSPIAGADVYGGAYGGSFYGYDPWFPGRWETSPRIPWWSLIPFKKDHHPHHRHRDGRGHQH